jgi:hypothetical protein
MLGLGSSPGPEPRIVEASPPVVPVAPTPLVSEPVAAEAPEMLPPSPPKPPIVPAPSAPPVRVLPPPADDAVVGDVPTVPVGPTERPRPRRTTEPKIFVPPRAPDDPGTGASDLEDLQGYPSKA